MDSWLPWIPLFCPNAVILCRCHDFASWMPWLSAVSVQVQYLTVPKPIQFRREDLRKRILYDQDCRLWKEFDCLIDSRPSHWLASVSLTTYWLAVANLSTRRLQHTKQAVREVDSNVQPVTFCFFQISNIFHISSTSPYVTYLYPTLLMHGKMLASCPSPYVAANAPQCQSFNDTNLDLHVIVAFSARDYADYFFDRLSVHFLSFDGNFLFWWHVDTEDTAMWLLHN